MKIKVTVLLLLALLASMSFKAHADDKQLQTDVEKNASLHFLSDSEKALLADKKFIVYVYGHHGIKWSIIYEDGDSYNFSIGTTRETSPEPGHDIDTLKLFEAYRSLINWGMNTLPEISKENKLKYPDQWSCFFIR